MKILVFSSEFPPGPGGIGAHAHHLTNQFVSHGHEVVVYSAARSGYPSNDFDLAQQASIIRYPAHSTSVTRLGHLLKHIWKHRNQDWIILSGLGSLISYSLIRLVAGVKTLCVVHGHEIVMAKGLSGFFVRRALNGANQVVAVSEFAKKILSDNGVVRSVVAIPNGVKLPEKMILRKRHTEKLVLITIGSITRRKGQHNVVAALPEIIKRFVNVEYHLVGTPQEKEGIEALTHKLGVSGCVFLHGAVSDEERDKLIIQADIFIMLSENLPDGDVEGFGIAVLEANSFGLPAIGSRNTGIEQAISHGSSGCLVDAHDPVQICDSIELILAQYSKFSQGAIAWARQHEWSKIGDRYLALMEGVDRA